MYLLYQYLGANGKKRNQPNIYFFTDFKVRRIMVVYSDLLQQPFFVPFIYMY